MNFTAKEDYGLRAVLDIAANAGSGPVQAREIAQRQRIPEQFLEQLLATLRRGEIIRSIRGAGGGYALCGPATDLSVGDILRALSGPLVPSDLLVASPGDAPETLQVRGVWSEIASALRERCDAVTLAELLERRAATGDAFLAMYI